MSVNPTLEQIRDLLAEIRDIQANTAGASLDSLNAIVANTIGSWNSLQAIYEKVNTMEANVSTIREWQLDSLLGTGFTGLTDLSSSIDNNLAQLKQLNDSFIAPMLENIYYAVNNSSVGAITTGCYNPCDAPAMLPPPGTDGPADIDVHCGRVQFFLAKIDSALETVYNGFTPGTMLSAIGAETLLGLDLIPGVDAITIPATLISGVVSILGWSWQQKIGDVRSVLENGHDALQAALYNAANGTDAAAAWNAYGDSQFNVLTNAPELVYWKMIGTSFLMNLIYDQAGHPWDISGFDTTICNPEGPSHTVVSSFVGCIFVDSGSNHAHMTEGARPWLDLNIAGHGTNISIGVGDCGLFSSFVENASYTGTARGTGWGQGTWGAHYRVKLLSSDGTVHFYDGLTQGAELTSTYVDLFGMDFDGLRIVGEMSAGSFQTAWQRLVSGEWVPIF